MVVGVLIAIAIIMLALSCTNIFGIASAIASCEPCVWLDNNVLTFCSDDINDISSIMIPQLAALLAICITVFVFLFAELNTRAHDHPGERIICNDLQKDFALRVELLSIESILLITLDYFSNLIYSISVNNIRAGHLLYALLMLESFWSSIRMIWYCVDASQYQRHLKWRAWDLTKRRYDTLRSSYDPDGSFLPEATDVSGFWTEYHMTSQLVCTIAGEPADQVDMDEKVIDRFAEAIPLGSQMTQNGLTEELKNLYDYQLALRVYDGYMLSASNDDDAMRTYSLHVISWFFTHLNELLDRWNIRFRKRPTSYYDETPGMECARGPLASQITRGIWRRIIQGDEAMSPMRSQRLNNMAFTGLNFAEGQLQNITMRTCRIVDATFDRSCLQGALFDDCDLRGASFRGVDCASLQFSDSNLDGIVITIGSADTSSEGRAMLIPKDHNMLVGMSVSGCSMVGATLAPALDDQTIDFSESDFSKANLQDAKICNALLRHCLFRDTGLSGTLFETCRGESVDFAGARLIGSTTTTKLRNCKFLRCNSSDCTFSNALIERCTFPYISAIGTVFENVRFEDDSFVNASFAHASFMYVRMKNVSMQDTDLAHVHMVDPHINDCKLLGSAGESFQILNGAVNNISFTQAHLPSAEFSRTKFTDCNFDRSSLPSALFHRATLTNTSFAETLLPNGDFADASLAETDAAHAFFTDTLFDRTTLRAVKMVRCDLSRAMFRHAELTNCRFDACTWVDASFGNASLSHCVFTTTSRKRHNDLRRSLMEAHSLEEVRVDDERIEP